MTSWNYYLKSKLKKSYNYEILSRNYDMHWNYDLNKIDHNFIKEKYKKRRKMDIKIWKKKTKNI